MDDRIERINMLLATVGPYPELMEEIKPQIAGRSFFPGGSGRVNGRGTPLPARPIMIVGQDFDTCCSYRASVRRGEELLASTWKSLLGMLEHAKIDPCECFYTNAIMGARREDPNYGPSPALDDDGFKERCGALLVQQICIIQPSVVVALGLIPIALLARQLKLAPNIPRPHWAKDSGNPEWTDLDGAGLQFMEAVRAPVVASLSFAFASSIHPSRSAANFKHRKWPQRQLEGRAANEEIWRCVRAAHLVA